jgi:hypothetical protein
MGKMLYDDGKYAVSKAIVTTPRRFYPLANTTASLRRDPLWLGLGIALFTGACLALYGDLLHRGEQTALIAVGLFALIGGWQTLVLRIDAIGHPRAVIIGSRSRMHGLYMAIRDARSIDGAFGYQTILDQ